MKRAARLVGAVGSFLLLIALFFSGRNILVRMQTPQDFEILFDTLFSAEYQREISTFVQTLDLQLASDPRSIATLLRAHFPLIASLKTDLTIAGVLQIAIKASDPLCRINDDLVVVEDGLMAAKNAYNSIAVAQLPLINALPEHLESWHPDELISLVTHVSSSLLDNYEIWLNKCPEILLGHKEQKKFSIFARAGELVASDLVEQGNVIAKILEDRGVFLQSKKKQWIVDMRFKELIVVVAK